MSDVCLGLCPVSICVAMVLVAVWWWLTHCHHSKGSLEQTVSLRFVAE